MSRSLPPLRTFCRRPGRRLHARAGRHRRAAGRAPSGPPAIPTSVPPSPTATATWKTCRRPTSSNGRRARPITRVRSSTRFPAARRCWRASASWRIRSRNASVPSRWPAGGRVFYEKRNADANQYKLYVRDGFKGAERLLVDPDALAKADGGTPHAIEFFQASNNGKLLAYAVSAGGSEDAVIHVIDVASGKELIAPRRSRALQLRQLAAGRLRLLLHAPAGAARRRARDGEVQAVDGVVPPHEGQRARRGRAHRRQRRPPEDRAGGISVRVAAGGHVVDRRGFPPTASRTSSTSTPRRRPGPPTRS